jgi:hypothetical protein
VALDQAVCECRKSTDLDSRDNIRATDDIVQNMPIVKNPQIWLKGSNPTPRASFVYWLYRMFPNDGRRQNAAAD